MLLNIFLTIIGADKNPTKIQNVFTGKYITTLGPKLELTDDLKEAVYFCFKGGMGIADEYIKICDKDDLSSAPIKVDQEDLDVAKENEKMNEKNHADKSLKPENEQSKPEEQHKAVAESVVENQKKEFTGKVAANVAGMAMTVDPPLNPQEKFSGVGVHLEEERKTPAQIFTIAQAEDDYVRVMNKDMCLTINVSSHTKLNPIETPVFVICNKEDDYNLFKFVKDSNADESKVSRVLDETKLTALKEAARLSPKLREKIGMDYLEMLG